MNIAGIDIGGARCAVLRGQMSDEGDIEVLDKLVCITSDYAAPDKMLPCR